MPPTQTNKQTTYCVFSLNQTGLGYGKLLHGEAVAIGMHMAADMSCRMGWVDRALVDRTVKLMQQARLPVELPKGGGMDMDKFLNVSPVPIFFQQCCITQ